MATSSAVPDSVSPALVKRGDCRRQRTWYQWVSGSVGAVDSHTVILQKRWKRRVGEKPSQPSDYLKALLQMWHTSNADCMFLLVTYTDPINATSNQNARPCTRPECIMWNLKGISILEQRKQACSSPWQWYINVSSQFTEHPQTCRDRLLWPPGN